MKRYRFEQFTAVRLHTQAEYSHDGQQIAFVTNTTGQFNIWIVPSVGGAARQLTAFEDWTVRDLAWSHDNHRIAFVADKDGNENRQIFIVDAEGGWPERVTDNLDAQYEQVEWSPDDKKLLYSGNDRDAMEKDPIEHDLETGELRRLMTGHRNYAVNYSPDGRYVTVIQFEGNTNQNIFVVETESGEEALVTPHEGDIIFSAGEWKPDSSGFYMITNDGREFNNLAFYDLKTGQRNWVYTGEHDVEANAISKDGSLLLISINDSGRSKLLAFDPQTDEPVDIPQLPTGVLGSLSLSPDGTKATLVFTSSKEATNLYEFDLRTGDMMALSQSMLGGIDLADMVDPELIHYETFDGKQIPAWLYKPMTGGDTFPVLLSIHGGPEAQERPTYNYAGLYQYLLNRGIAILAPNIRGSSGFGITYQTYIHRDWGGAELKDIEYAAKYLQSLDWIDSERIGVFGGSFGGFATLSAVTRLPDYWAVGVDIVGPSNLVTFAKSVPEHWKPSMKKWVGDPDEDYDMLMERSPITYVNQVKTPLLVIQGANDPRVVKAESDQLVEAMRANGTEVEYYVDPEEGHGAARTKNRNKWFRMIANYLVKHLVGMEEAQPVMGD